MAVEAATGGRTVYVADVEDGPNAVLAHRFPGATNLGDVTAIEWTPGCPDCGAPTIVERSKVWRASGYRCQAHGVHSLALRTAAQPVVVDVVGGGSPCQDISISGARKGMVEGTRSNLWTAMREGIARLRPGLVVWENVRGALSAHAYSESEKKNVTTANGDLGSAEGSVDVRSGDPLLRAIGRVLGDLSSLGYDAQWQTLPASASGAPHRRDRVFVLAHPAELTDR